ncbi:hypothetical protein [Nocardia seriolae]|uniref:hypothetical protein n=1 Tax=Nocardia seriolae TaxID=37332 RepID=UPI0004B8F14A|nr:hypothetical protein [Nocardia seriolae]MTJ62647.1 hypothetical protein [Nocardia seriolae]MTJ73669.1 hypothetical protein [Nocardia seriolae]MTJ89311.1 hypothetical protein [Nocardia seriolae]MTK33289.1 hypothetical protein [Nocardia seriolae]MTK49877.1 hypothetical protein [Nocardia seriolae]
MIMTLAGVEPIRASEPGMFDRTVARLCAEFGGAVSRWQVESVLRGCLSDLAGSPAGAMAELGERLTRQRLLDSADALSLRIA